MLSASILPAGALAMNGLRAQEASPGETRDFNREWKFQIGDHPGAGAVSFNDAKWEAIGLPHGFSMPYFAAGKGFPSRARPLESLPRSRDFSATGRLASEWRSVRLFSGRSLTQPHYIASNLLSSQ